MEKNVVFFFGILLLIIAIFVDLIRIKIPQIQKYRSYLFISYLIGAGELFKEGLRNTT